VNVAIKLPAPTVTEAGTVSAVALLDSVTVAPPVFDSVTVHVAFAPDAKLVGLQVSPLTTVAVASEIAAVCVLPFNFAVMVAVWSLAIVPAVAANVAVALPAPTVTEAGIAKIAESFDSVTTAPAVFDTVTVHVALAPEPRLVGLHVSPLTTVAVASEIEAVCVLPFSVAVTVAV
jgi:post-segregation antitoxin (ccd killing protein)